VENRPLEKCYSSLIFIDALGIKIRREYVGNESAYIISGINKKIRKRLKIMNSLSNEKAAEKIFYLKSLDYNSK